MTEPLLYARIDLVTLDDGTDVVLEVELAEPAFFLDVDPDAADRFAALVAERAATATTCGDPGRPRVGRAWPGWTAAAPRGEKVRGVIDRPCTPDPPDVLMEQPQLGPAGRPGPGLGCLGPILGVVVLVAVVAAVATIGLVVLAIVAVVVVIGLVVFAVDRLLLALSPKRRERRDDLLRSWGMGGGRVIDSTAIDTTATVEVRDPETPTRPPAPSGDGDGGGA